MRVGIVGCGRWGSIVAKRIHSMGSRARVAWVHDEDEGRELALARLLSPSVDFEGFDLEEVDSEAVDAVVLAVPPSWEFGDENRMSLIELFFARGIRKIRIEKPVTFAPDELDRLRELERDGLELSVGHQMIFDPCCEALLDLIDGEEIVRMDCVRVSPRATSGGFHPFIDQGVHDLLLALKIGAITSLDSAFGSVWERHGAFGYTLGSFSCVNGVSGRVRRVTRILTTDAEYEWDEEARTVTRNGHLCFGGKMMDPLGVELLLWTSGRTVTLRDAHAATVLAKRAWAKLRVDQRKKEMSGGS